MQLTGLNFFAGDMPGGDRGLVSSPKRSSEFRDNLDVTVGIGERLGCRAFNALYGNRDDRHSAGEQDDLAVENLGLAAQAAARIQGTVLVEPVSGAAQYPLLTAADALTVIDRVQASYGAPNLGLLADLYHLAVNGDDVDRVIADHAERIAHVQIADAPGRNEPGTGTLPLERQLGDLATSGYTGWIGLEYKPSTTTLESFGWLPREHRAVAALTQHWRFRHDEHRLHRPRHHGQPDGRPPRQRRAPGRPTTTSTPSGPSRWSKQVAGPRIRSPTPCRTPTWSA